MAAEPRNYTRKNSFLTRIATTESVSFVRADEKLTAFVELERAIHEFALDLIS